MLPPLLIGIITVLEYLTFNTVGGAGKLTVNQYFTRQVITCLVLYSLWFHSFFRLSIHEREVHMSRLSLNFDKSNFYAVLFNLNSRQSPTETIYLNVIGLTVIITNSSATFNRYRVIYFRNCNVRPRYFMFSSVLRMLRKLSMFPIRGCEIQNLRFDFNHSDIRKYRGIRILLQGRFYKACKSL